MTGGARGRRSPRSGAPQRGPAVNGRGPEDFSTTGTSGPGEDRRRFRTAADVLAVAMIVAGVVLAGISAVQHQHHDHAVVAEAARKTQVDRAARAEAGRFRLANLGPVHQPGSRVHANRTGGTQPQRPTLANPGRAPQQQTGAGPVSAIGGPGAILVIPALRVRAPIVATGAVDGFMTVPADIHTVGWYDGIDGRGARASARTAPWPGQPGVSLLAGHVDWAGEGPGALYYINQLVVGDPIEVVGSNGTTTRWRVSEAPLTISKKALPADLFANTGPPRLILVTCGGSFDAATGHYLDNVIVWATPALS